MREDLEVVVEPYEDELTERLERWRGALYATTASESTSVTLTHPA
jgi:hypothetical protein